MSTANEKDLKDTDDYTVVDPEVSRFYEVEPRLRARVDIAGRSHPGKVRPNNEDQYLAVRRYRGREILVASAPLFTHEPPEDTAYALAVADGMGGSNFGEIASLLAMRVGWELGGSEIKWSVRMNEREAEDLREKAEVFFRLIDQALHAETLANPRLTGMGTTLTICYSTGPELFVMHAGDSRAYLYNHGTLRRLTRDHTLGQFLVDSGVAEPGSAQVKKTRHILTNYLGGNQGGVAVDVDQHRLAEGDRLLLCTDGLTDMVSEGEIARLLASHPSSSEACRALIDRALENGGKDNVTVVLAHYQFEGNGNDTKPAGERATLAD
jgi:serine/threonine protein phosphatase PrpC